MSQDLIALPKDIFIQDRIQESLFAQTTSDGGLTPIQEGEQGAISLLGVFRSIDQIQLIHTIMTEDQVLMTLAKNRLLDLANILDLVFVDKLNHVDMGHEDFG
jgi:hypothetical protein